MLNQPAQVVSNADLMKKGLKRDTQVRIPRPFEVVSNADLMKKGLKPFEIRRISDSMVLFQMQT